MTTWHTKQHQAHEENGHVGDHLFVSAKYVDALRLNAARMCKMCCMHTTKNICAMHIATHEGLPDPVKRESVSCVLAAGSMLQSEGKALRGETDSEAAAHIGEHEQAQEKLYCAWRSGRVQGHHIGSWANSLDRLAAEGQCTYLLWRSRTHPPFTYPDTPTHSQGQAHHRRGESRRHL